MGTAKVVSLSVRPLEISHLCFEVDGILGESKTELGAPAVAFDFAAFYAILGAVPAVTGDPSRLLYNFSEIQAFVSQFSLAALRAEAGKAFLNKAINARQNAYFAKYANATDIILRMNKYYSPSVGDSKPTRLEILSAIANQQAADLKTAYVNTGRLGVVKTTESVLNSRTYSQGKSTETGQSNELEIALSDISGQVLSPPKDGAVWSTNWSEPVGVTLEEGTNLDTTGSKGRAFEHQKIVNTDYAYRIPYFESQAQNERAQISLIDQQFSQFMFGQNLPNLEQVFKNELNSIDSDVYRLQIAFLNTILISPIRGTVTGIYKNPGDAVKAGEPVIRVENSEVILLVATLIYAARISIGSVVTVKTGLFDSSTSQLIIGRVVAARGGSEDNQWEVIVRCDNTSGGHPIFPLGYHFDYDDTTVTI